MRKELSRLALVLLTILVSQQARGGVVAIQHVMPFSPTEEDLPYETCGRTKIQRAWNELAKVSDYLLSKKLRCARDVLADAFITESGSSGGSGATAVWKSNSSMNMSQQLRLSRSPCLAVLTNRFYSDFDKRYGKFSAHAGEDVLPGTQRPSLLAEAGKGSFSEMPPGFLMDQALRLSSGRKSLAMALIAHCGHDDQNNQLSTVVDFSSVDARKTVAAYLERVEKNSDHASLNQDSLKRLLAGDHMKAIIKCPPPNSPFYVAKALGAGADIPESLKSKVAEIQAPTKGGGVLPGKAYHTNFGAIVGCRLASCGVSKESIQSLLQTIASKYRAHRLSGIVASYQQVREMIEERFGVNWVDEKGIRAQEKDISAWLASGEAKEEMSKRGAEVLASNDRGKMSWDAWQANIDAAILYRGGIPGFPGAYQAVEFSKGRDPFYDPQIRYKPHTSYCPGWSEARCNEARKRYESWMIDFDWSEAQQAAGGGFGADFCAKDPASDEEVEQQACEALKQL